MKLFCCIAAMLYVLAKPAITSAQSNELTIAAASDLKFALDSVISDFKKANPGAEIKAIYGSSGKLFEQISNDAPFDIYFSADISYPEKLKEKGLTISEAKIYGIGRLVMWSKKI